VFIGTGATLLGVDQKQALHRCFESFLIPEDHDRWRQHCQNMLQSDNKPSSEFTIRRDDGSSFYALLNCRHWNALTSPLLRVSFIDITKRKQLEHQLQYAKKMEALGQLTGGIAHDFNNILASILGYSNLALERCLPTPSDKLARYLREIISAGEQARDLIAKMLAYSRTSSAIATDPLDMAPEVRKALAMLSAAIPAGIDVSPRIEAGIPPVMIDPIEVQQVLINLAVNARDALNEQDGRIDIILKRASINRAICDICHNYFDGDFVVLEVKDNGRGIPANLQQRIFDPFFTTKEVGKGSGLGLSMVQGVVIKNKGHLLVESGTQGTSFQLLFPFADTHERIPATAAPMPPCSRIWVIEDQEPLANYYLDLLEEQGYQVSVFTDPSQALRTFQQNPDSVDIVLTGQTMPHLNGTELATAMLAVKPELPVILTTGYNEKINADTVKRLGIRCYLNKPVDGKKLLAMLAAELGINENKFLP
jgi:PAS domain S-box-containing protein